jgi:hypothetical protein
MKRPRAHFVPAALPAPGTPAAPVAGPAAPVTQGADFATIDTTPPDSARAPVRAAPSALTR